MFGERCIFSSQLAVRSAASGKEMSLLSQNLQQEGRLVPGLTLRVRGTKRNIHGVAVGAAKGNSEVSFRFNFPSLY